MKKTHWNLIIDALMFASVSALAGIGFLMHWVLIPGWKQAAVYGRRVDLSFLGMGRHDWGDVHLWISLGMLGLLVLHIVLHWDQIVGIYCRLIPSRAVRWAVCAVFVVACAALLAIPLFALSSLPAVTAAGHID